MAARRLFGTDGIRGTVNAPPMTAEMAMRLGMAAGVYFRRGDHRHLVVIGKDTRLSGYMLEAALQAGFTAAGMDVRLFGPVPTPAVAMLTLSQRADLGVMLSASHNPYEDNGIKLFGPDGYKLSDAAELEIEALMDRDPATLTAEGAALGRAKRVDDAGARYSEVLKANFPRGLRLDGLRIAVDCAHGAAYRVAPQVLYELGAEVITTGTAPDGFNINAGVGATVPKHISRFTVENQADVGIALDGDADRVILCDETGRMVDGDQLLAFIAKTRQAEGTLRGDRVVATVMSNLGLERYLGSLGLGLDRTAVGDRYVVERMREGGFDLGGEQSGHIVLGDIATTGDGLLAALQVLAGLVRQRPAKASKVLRLFEPVPQVLRNVRLAAREQAEAVLHLPTVKDAVAATETALNGKGRLLLRCSGTEPLIRVMVEGDDSDHVTGTAEALVAQIKQAAAAL